MPEMVICNTSPLFYLHRLGLTEVLKKLYGEIIIPQTVLQELENGKDAGEDVPEISNYPWIKVKSLTHKPLINIMHDLGPGEAGVLALALQNPSSLVILDDLMARNTARSHGFKVTGTLGILLKAKQKGYITAVAPIIKRLLDLGFWVSQQVQLDLLSLAGESEIDT